MHTYKHTHMCTQACMCVHCIYICMCVCICVFVCILCSLSLQLKPLWGSQFWKKGRKNAMRRHKNPSMTSAWQWKPLARPGWMPLLQFLATHESTSTPREVWAEAARCLPTGAFTFNNSEVQLCRNVAKLFFPTIYTFSIYPIGRGRDGLKKRERERF